MSSPEPSPRPLDLEAPYNVAVDRLAGASQAANDNPSSPASIFRLAAAMLQEFRNLDPWLRYSLAPLYDPDAQAFKDTWIPSDLPFKVTPWRAINTAVIFSFGLAKAIATYRGLSTAPTTLDWMLGVTWTLM